MNTIIKISSDSFKSVYSLGGRVYGLFRHIIALIKYQLILLIRRLFHTRKSYFTKIYKQNFWGDSESRSGAGSNLERSTVIRTAIPELINELHIDSVLDIPCGDFFWMNQTELDIKSYLGADIVEELISKNIEKYGENKNRTFRTIDLVKDDLPQMDLVFSRDCLVHLSYRDIFRALEKIKRSKSTYLLTTTFTNRFNNFDIVTGEWHPINLQAEPFNFPMPVKIINENCDEDNGNYSDKSLALWLIKDLP